MSTPLIIWMNGLRVGTWTQARGMDILHYDPSWVESVAGRALSLSLPFTPGNIAHRGEVVANFFDNLLPDSDGIRARIRSKFSTASTGVFDLLTAIGRDCVGAVQLLPHVPRARWRREGTEDIEGKALPALLLPHVFPTI